MRPKNQPGIKAWRGSSLRVRRSYQVMSAEELARRIGVSKSTIARWETDEHEPTADRVLQLAEVLSVSPQVFAREPKIR